MRNALLVVMTALAFGCSQPPVTDAGGSDASDAVVDAPATVDVRDVVLVDAGPPFSPCTTNAECPGPAGLCITEAQGYPSGLCTRRCTADSQCNGGVCTPYASEHRCIPTCVSGSDCRDGYGCFVSSSDPNTHLCLPLCSADSQCGTTTCDRYTGFCGTADTTRVDNGGQCMSTMDCRSGRCFTEFDVNTGAPTGALDGQCYSLCVTPDDSQYATTLPHGSCPNNGVCARTTNGMAGDIGFCRPECTTASDCHAGYICVHPNRIGGTGTTTNGYCAAMNCHYMTQMCPPFATCNTTATNDAGMPTSGICIRSDGGVGDGGTDAMGATDATDATDAVTETGADATGEDAGADASDDIVTTFDAGD